MNPKPNVDLIEDLLVEEALDPTVAKDQLCSELRSAGIDTNGILGRAMSLIGAKVRDGHRQKLTAANADRVQRFSAARATFASWPIERVRKWLQDLASGSHGANPQLLAQPCFQHRSSEEMTEEEILNLAAEVKATMDSNHGE